MATVKLILRNSKLRSDGTAPIYLRVTANRRSRYISTGIYLAPRDWNEDRQQVRRSHELADAYNTHLQTLRNDAERLGLEASTASEVKQQLAGTGGSLTDYLQRFIEGLDKNRQFWSWKRYRVVLGKLQGCFGQRIDWQDIDGEGLRRFERYMADKLKNGPNTVRKELAMLHRIYRKAIKEGVLRADHDPFVRYDAPKAKTPERRKLTPDEIEKLAHVALTPGSWAAKARDAWLISFYLGGMRFGDVACLKVKDVQNGRCTYRMNKTGQLVSVPIPEQARPFLAPYLKGKEPEAFVLPFLKPGDDSDERKLRRRISSKNVLCNRFVKVAARRAEVDNAETLSMHISRHSFADYARTKSGNLYAISKTLGHSSLQITQTYLKSFDQDAVDQLADELWKK